MTNNRYQALGRGRWCACGHYLGGLGYEDARWGRRKIARYAKERYRLHPCIIRGAA